MILLEVARVLEGRFLLDLDADAERVEIESVCASDLMSDVLAFARPRALLITALANPQAVRTAEMSEIAAICFVRGKQPPESSIELARESNIPLMATRFSTYTCCGILYAAGLVGCDGCT